MGLVDVNGVSKRFQDKDLFTDLSFTLNEGDRLAIIGNNGVGKTTLLKMILKEEDYDGGNISIAFNKSVGYLSQVMIHSFENTLYEEMLHAFSDVLDLKRRLDECIAKMSENPDDAKLLKQYGSLENEFLNAGGYDYEYRIEMMISKFGFTKADYNRKISSFSGGERNKIAFTRLLLDNPDILILDEPTNHLDVDTIEWLEEYLNGYQGAIILVSHDRYFIDAICNCILEISDYKGEYYRGNYSYYLQEKVVRYEQRLKAYNLQQKEIEHLEMLIKKFKPKPTKVSLAKDREKKLARIMANKIKVPVSGSKKINLNIKALDDRRVRQLTMDKLSFGYDRELGFIQEYPIYGGDKIGIIGKNGVGKTTLLKTINHLIEPLSGRIIEHRDLQFGYIDQNQIQIDSDLTIFDYLHSFYPYLSNFDIRHHLGSFLFTEDDVFKTVNQLSGGEKVRLSFARLLLRKYDILLLDEPTNHMDIETRKVLESTLLEYPGTIVFVSHDRYFIDELASKLIIIDENGVQLFDSTYNDYQIYLKNKAPLVLEKKEKEDKRIKVKKRSAEKVEQDIAKINKEIEDLKASQYLEENYLDKAKMEDIDKRISTKEEELKTLEEEYLEIIDLNDK